MSSGKILPFTDPIDHRLPGHMPDCEDRGAPNEDDVVAWEEEEDARAQEIIEAERAYDERQRRRRDLGLVHVRRRLHA